MFLYCCLAYLTLVTYLTYSVIVSFLRETYFCLALIAFLVYLSYRLIVFFFQDTFELRINVNDWHFDFSWNHIQQTPATATPVTWNSSTTTVINPTPEEDLWPGHPTWNAATWNTPTVKEAINNVKKKTSSHHDFVYQQPHLCPHRRQLPFLGAHCPSPTTYDDNSNNANNIFSWKQDDTKALGYLILHVQESIHVKHDALVSAKAFWDALSTEYGTQGISATYGEIKAMLDTPLPSNQHPASAFNKINAHFTRLKKADFEIPIKVQAMILLSKLPSSMNSITQIVSMDKEMLTPTGIKKAAILCWEQADNSRSKHKEVQKLSAVKRKQPDPKFNQQQQHQQQPPKQGTRGGKNCHQNNHDHAHLASTVDFATPTIIDTLSIIDPRRLAHTPGAQFFGPPAWDNTQKAFNLAHVLGVEPSFETIRALDKIAASSIAPSFEVEPAPKHLCLEDHLSTTVPAYDDDTVSLGSDYIEDDIYNMYIDNQANEGENVVEYQWQVPFSSPQKQYAYFSTGACFNAHIRIAMSSISVEPCPNESCVHMISFSACVPQSTLQ
ncbi:hypothetical protein PAXINDRAFT_19164 [Paxillus involutus ATCC 200175]|uniref:Unplaced genomic scaffold PAXINscaffold_498, whole genome shotgun sequence n=1 Tax=Paxillus involutus ATCC 200175 TaxID=664439 RepID=A0A0C9TIE0_PAXIN|nr:hypothetical protein PAXINDRAFT_19164 [Paxillus involutus ATCC 200175]